MPRAEAAARLAAAVRATKPMSLAEVLAVHLDGEVTEHGVELYRRRGSSVWYGTFRGRFEDGGKTTRLVGAFEPSWPVALTWGAGFLFLWSATLAIAVLIHWEGAISAGWLMAAALASMTGVVALRFRGRNARAEAELLEREIQGVFNNRG